MSFRYPTPQSLFNVLPSTPTRKAFGLIVRRINDEPFDVPSVPGSRAVTIKFMIPNSRMGSVIGKQGSKIKEIQDASGARLNASEGMLPGSTEVRYSGILLPSVNLPQPQRVLSVAGVADAIHIATYYIGNILIEAQERMPSGSHSSYKPTSNRRSAGYVGSSYVPGGSGYSNPYLQGVSNPAQQLQTQQIYIPNDLVGCIIGKGGSKINEIRHMSASQIKIMEPGAGPVGSAPGGSEGERLVVITGPPANIQMAVQLLYHVRCLPFLISPRVTQTPRITPSAWSRRNRSRSVRWGVIPHKLHRHYSDIVRSKEKPSFFSFLRSHSITSYDNVVVPFFLSRSSLPRITLPPLEITPSPHGIRIHHTHLTTLPHHLNDLRLLCSYAYFCICFHCLVSYLSLQLE